MDHCGLAKTDEEPAGGLAGPELCSNIRYSQTTGMAFAPSSSNQVKNKDFLALMRISEKPFLTCRLRG